MVLGLKAKNRRGPSVQVEYLIRVQDIKPWPPTQSLKSVRSVLIQWENGDRVSGSTSSVVPSINDGKIEFNESFRLNAVLSRDMSVKNGDAAVFHKNLLEFNLYEPRRDQTVKGQLLGTAIVDLADYGVVKEIISVGVPINCTRSFRNTAQPMLNLKIQPYDKARSNSSLRGKLEKEASLEKSAGDSVSTLMSDEYADEAEVASVSDDDVSSHSSLTALSAVESCGGSPAVSTENGTSSGKCHTAGTENRDSVSKLGEKSEMRSLSNTPLSNTSDLEYESNSPIILVPGAEPLKSCQALENASEIREEVVTLKGTGQPKTKLEDNVSILQTKVIPVHVSQKLNSENDVQPVAASVNENESQASRGDSTEIAATANTDHMVTRSGDKHEHNRHDSPAVDDKNLFIGDESSYRSLMDSGQKQVLYGIDSPLSRDRLRHVKSVRSPMDSSRSNGGSSGSTGKQDSKVYPTDKRTTSITIAQELEQRIEMLEEELREAAALEIALYSVVAEHVSSMNRIHAPARRLSRLYLQASKEMRASAAHSAVSGLVVVAKACGNDVPRLTFWLSNCIVLRGIICGTFVEEQVSASGGPSVGKNGVRKGMNKESLVLKWNVSSYAKKGNKNALILEDWGNPHAFMSALEKVESWIFSRVVESVWWQTLTPHMQSSAAKVIGEVVDSQSKSFYRRTSSSGNHEQVNFSLELWKKAFKDACERLCPVRAGGHECGCLPVLPKLIMEQCVTRLDVAMFNAILRESADDIPTDPVSDPISDAKVLPIPAGRSSFGAGAQLKNAIGNWSRILTDLFGMDDDDAPDDEREDSDETHKHDSSFKSFHLLKSLSDLMMLPKDMLLNESIRREVCPALSMQVIKRALDTFVPDEFCLDPIPGAVFESLNSENDVEDEEGLMTNFPLTAPAVFYSAPSATSLASLLDGTMGMGSQFQLRRSGSVLKRSNTSDDELDELDSPLNSILCDSVDASPKEIKPNLKVVQNHGKKTIRYQLLRQMWGDGML